MSGWIKLHRTLQKWGWKKSPNHLAVFVDLLLEANHNEGEYMGVKIPRGSLTTSIKAISQRTGVTKKSVRTILNHLKATNEVALTPTTKFTMISVVKWDDYQATGEPSGKQVANDGQTAGKQRATNKKLIIKEGKKNPADASSEMAETVLNLFNEICSRSFKSSGPNLRCIKARLKEGYTLEDFRIVTEDRFKDWKDSPRMKRFIKPDTLFNEDKFDGYLQSAKASLRPDSDPMEAFVLAHLGNDSGGEA